jgi:hypothetical protein
MNFDFITEQIAVGQRINSAALAKLLRDCGITHVLNLFAGDSEAFWTGDVRYVPQEDDGSPRTPEQLLAAIQYENECARSGGKLYIHCQWGLGRAPATCYAILRAHGMTMDDAVALICRQRPSCAQWTWRQYIPSIESALCFS